MSEEELFNKVNALLQKYDQPPPKTETKPENKTLTPQNTQIEEPQKQKSDEEKKSNDSDKESEKDNESSASAELEEINDCIGDHSSENSESENEEYKHLKEELDKGNNFIDYFLVVGVEPNIFMNQWLYDTDLETLNTDYKSKLEPKIISSFPQFEKHTISFDESILLHCFPNGYKLIHSIKRPQPKLFSFILDNNYFNLNYPQKYLTCLICYESIAQYRMLYEQNKRIPKNDSSKKKHEDITENDYEKIRNTVKNRDIFIPKCLLIMSLDPHFGEFEKILTEIYNYSQGIKYINTPTVVQTPEKKSEKINLKDIKNVDITIPIDKIIENLLIELPIPPRGFSTVEYTLNDEKRIIPQNKMNDLPLVNINLKRLFIDFEVKEILDIYNILFLEGRILFFSKYIELLNIYIYGFLSLLYPFQYQYQIVTILPEKNFEIMESITPFIAGINQPYEKDFFEKRDFTLSDSILIVDIDKGCIELCNEVNKFPEFPKNPRKNIERNLILIVNKYLKEEIRIKSQILGKAARESINLPSSVILKNNEVKKRNTIRASVRKPRNSNKSKTEIEDDFDDVFSNFNIDYNFNKEVNELFFNFNASLLCNYSKFLNLDFYSSNIMPCLEILFKVDDFLKEIPQAEKDFYERFVSETQLFGDFLYLRMIPKSNKEKIRILRFDEKIMEITSNLFNRSSIQTVFTNCKEYEFTDKYEISKPRNLTGKEISTNEKLKARKLLLNYGIIFTEKKDNTVNIYYPIFPKLTTKLFFYQNVGEYYPPQNSWGDSIESTNEYIISKSHLGGVSFRQNDMKNYIYICWMQMWAMTFWYCEEKEQNYRFQELLKVLDKTSCHEMEIFNLLFETLSKYGKNDNMILKLYAILLKLHLNPSLKVHKIVMNIIDKKQLEGNFNEKLQKILEKDKSVVYEKKDFRKRVFRSKYYEDNLTENITFFAFDNCVDCQQPINLEKLSKDFDKMSRDLVWSKCPSCNEPLLPKIMVQFGKEINKNGELKKNTSNYENVVLFSPYILKVNYSTILFKNFGIKLDVEELMPKYPGIFWDSLWYFKLNGLEYDFMLPYKRDSNINYIKNDNLMILTTASKCTKDINKFTKEDLEKINAIDDLIK